MLRNDIIFNGNKVADLSLLVFQIKIGLVVA